jgi:hypothetical protein
MKTVALRVEPGPVTRQYLPDEVSQILERWLSAFGQDRAGVNADAFLWHIFSAARYPSETGAAAKASYEQAVAHEYVVLSNDRKIAFTTSQHPESCSLTDYYVFPPNLAWTMAFTHEDGWLGPYFARHRDFEALDRENATRLRKEREAEAARHKGWR